MAEAVVPASDLVDQAVLKEASAFMTRSALQKCTELHVNASKTYFGISCADCLHNQEVNCSQESVCRCGSNVRVSNTTQALIDFASIEID